jgi:hypothetical protein
MYSTESNDFIVEALKVQFSASRCAVNMSV